MAARPNWRGYLKLSLVSCPVALYNATTSSEKVAFHLLHRQTGNRLRRHMVDPETGETVEAEDQIHGYETSKGEFVTIEDDELAAVALESTHTMDVDQFVARADVSDIYLDAPYYLVPNDEIGEEAFAVIREAMRKRKMAGIAKIVLYRRERIVLLEPQGRGILATTLRYPYEVKAEADFFGEIPDIAVGQEMLELADHIIETKQRAFEPDKFEDRYENALLDLIKAKQAGKPLKPAQPAAAPSNVVDLMEALRRSVKGPSGSAPPAEPAPQKSAAKPKSKPKAKAGKPPARSAAASEAKASASKIPARSRKKAS